MGGFFGVVSGKNCIKDIYYGTDYHYHLGTRTGGIAPYYNDNFTLINKSIHENYFRPQFISELKHKKANSAIGIITDDYDRATVISSRLGKFGIVAVGRANNIDEIVQEAFESGVSFSVKEKGHDFPQATEVVGKYIIGHESRSIEEGLIKAQERIKGSFSALLMSEKGIYAMRDRLGRTPVIIGKKKKAYAAASESFALDQLGYSVERELGPGEIVFFDKSHIEQVKQPGKEMQACSFLWIYYGYPNAVYEGMEVSQARMRCGAALARNDTVFADFVAPIPDSGLHHAAGYAEARDIHQRFPISKYSHTWARSFTPWTQEKRDEIAQKKLTISPTMLKGAKVIFLDDSIVRGTQLRNLTSRIRKSGAKEIHMRIASPPPIYPCEFLNFSNTKDSVLAGIKAIQEIKGSASIDDDIIKEFLANGSERYNEMVENIRQKIGLDSLAYQKLEDMIESIGLPKQNLCTHCWDRSSYS